MPDRVISLTSLPNEVLAQISEELLPGDIWSLASTNRLLRLLVEPHLFQYQASFNHSTLTLRECGKTASKTVVKTSSVITYLARISNDPQFAQYPLSIVTSNPEGKEYEMTLGRNSPPILKEPNMLRLLSNSPYTRGIDTDGIDELPRWTEAFKAGNESALLVLLMSLLPNLGKIKFTPGFSIHAKRIQSLIGKIVAAHYPPHRYVVSHPISPDPDLPLSKLRTIVFDCEDASQGRDGLQCLTPFFDLPSLRTIRGKHVGRGASEKTKGWPPSRSNCRARSISFEQSSIPPDVLCPFLRSIGALRKFEYNLAADKTPKVVLNDVISTLLHCAGDTLRDLQIYVSRNDIGELYYHVPFGIQSLHAFATLKRIYLDVDLLIKPESPAWHGRDPGEPLRLVDDMPCFLEVLKLEVRCGASAELQALFEGLVEGKEERLPYLRKIHLVYWDVEVLLTVNKVCVLAGIELEQTRFRNSTEFQLSIRWGQAVNG